MTDSELNEIEARANAATDGWYVDKHIAGETAPLYRIYDRYHQGVCKMTSGGEFHDKPNAEFIAHARTDIPKLIAALHECRRGK